jgi:lysozyme family protein
MDEVREIYFRGYWLGVGAEKLEIIDGRTAAAVFDFGVNAGAGTSVKLLQRVLGVKETATVDTPTLAALRSRNMVDVARQLMALRLRHYYALATRRAKDRVFILNWTSRTKRVADSLGVVVQLTGSERGWAPGKPEARVLDLRPLAADATRVPVPAVVGVVAAGAPDPAPRLKPVVLGAALLAAYAAARGMGLIE